MVSLLQNGNFCSSRISGHSTTSESPKAIRRSIRRNSQQHWKSDIELAYRTFIVHSKVIFDLIVWFNFMGPSILYVMSSPQRYAVEKNQPIREEGSAIGHGRKIHFTLPINYSNGRHANKRKCRSSFPIVSIYFHIYLIQSNSFG